MNIALFGGSFNPIHSGHIKLIKAIKDNFHIQKLILMPTAVSPHKSNSEMTTEINRFNMCKLACKDLDYVDVSDLEIKRKGKSYTYLTINDLKKIYPDDKLYLVVGADMFMCFEIWKNFSDILSKASLITVPRDNVSYEQLVDYSYTLNNFGGESFILKDSVMDVSSSEIRYKIKNNLDVSNLLDADVLKYIKDNKLYGCE